MALGFGFNKAKVLAQAEKFVQQGKLTNAISEYEKIIKEDPKDLTVLNTIGDLNARVGNNDQATFYFKRVGDQYAQNGFAVKAIAIYKKLTKLSPNNSENIIKLAELYGQQGLFNDARVHYMQVADQLLKSGDNNQAARIFQKILELDPENAHTQSKLADLYQKLGKKDEARNIYYSAAESLYARGSYDAAEEALGRVLTLDPTNTGALMLRGLIAVDAGDSHAAVSYLEQVSDLDSRPDGLRALLRAKLHSGSIEGVEGIADKLLTAHKDATGISTVAQWYVTNNHLEAALRLYEKYATPLFGGNMQALHETLSPLASRAKDNAGALAILQRLTDQGGDHAQSAEMIELQANAAAKKGSYVEARDLYKKLMEMEPENALHSQNYKQMLVKLGEDSATRILTPEEAAQAFMVEELDESAPSVHQSYDPPTERAIESALTDAELYVSYNVPSKAIPPLEAALPLAPQDINLNQRLASLYVRAERFADAARLYQNLSEIYKELGHSSESAKYLEAAKRFALRVPAAAAIPAIPIAEPPRAAKATWPPPVEPVAAVPEPVLEAVPEVESAPSVQEFTFDTPHPEAPEPEIVAPVDPLLIQPEPAEIIPEPVAIEPPLAPADSPAPVHAHEIDISNEWEDMIEVEPANESELPVHEIPVEPVSLSEDIPSPVAEVELEPEPVSAGPDLALLAQDKVQEIRFYIAQEMWDPANAALDDLEALAPDAIEIAELRSEISAGQSKLSASIKAEAPAVAIEDSAVAFTPFEVEEPPAVQTPSVAPAPVIQAPPVVQAQPPVMHAPVPPLRTAPPVEKPVLFDQEDVLDIPEETRDQPAPSRSTAPREKTTEDILGDFVLDLEQSDLADFAPREKSPTVSPVPVPAPAPVVAAAPAAQHSANGDMQDTEMSKELTDILFELQEETAEAAEPDEDPETHYNLGIAFKEMGLLDEAIGELQKVCRAVDRGVAFSQPIQALTWLAQCLVDKGAPEAAVRWYQKALQQPGLDDNSRCSVYYDLGMAFEASGDKKSALSNFMEVYGSNIDFRDVASRIKALKS